MSGACDCVTAAKQFAFVLCICGCASVCDGGTRHFRTKGICTSFSHLFYMVVQFVVLSLIHHSLGDMFAVVSLAGCCPVCGSDLYDGLCTEPFPDAALDKKNVQHPQGTE